MHLSRKTFEDLISDIADDTKTAFDEVLDRPKDRRHSSSSSKSKGVDVAGSVGDLAGGFAVGEGGLGGLGGMTGGAAGMAGGVGGMAGGVGGMAGGLGTVTDLGGAAGGLAGAGLPLDTVQSLAALPGQIQELSNLISTLLAALEGVSGALSAAGSVTKVTAK